ncbi:hypothetical protein TNCV_3060631 [Trichonephila clavipes]|uniref:Uncharacterized protein n=1 Tax=Trichonephila clavipes TaxID=2585209 RepID=A0A8X6VZZ7_TRICX|nr:hypothetical protein TNCV_3060631 [Trichonephila clavipes]
MASAIIASLTFTNQMSLGAIVYVDTCKILKVTKSPRSTNTFRKSLTKALQITQFSPTEAISMFVEDIARKQHNAAKKAA